MTSNIFDNKQKEDFLNTDTQDYFKKEDTITQPTIFKNLESQSQYPKDYKDFYEYKTQEVKALLLPHEEKIDFLVKEIELLKIGGEEDSQKATKFGGKCNEISKAIEKQRKQFVEEPNAYVKAINNLSNYYKDKLDMGIAVAKGKITVYLAQKQLEIQKKEAEERQALLEIQKKIDEETAKLNKEAQLKAKEDGEKVELIIAPKVPDVVPVKQSTMVRSETGSAHQVLTWAFEVEDINKVPLEYLIVDEKSVREAIRGGIRNIEGIKIYEETSIRFRK